MLKCHEPETTVMTLRRQLTFIIATLFVLLFIGTFAINVHNTRAYLNDQLNSISQDMATSLGLTLSPYMAENDMVVIESHVNALYDSGYYREIVISDIDGKPLIERISSHPVEKVPNWFINMFPLQTPQGESLIMSGWTQAGSVKVSAHPEFAYIRLWSTCVQSFYLFLIGFAVLFGLVMIVLHYVLRPLKAVQKQAEAISNKEYVIQAQIPWTRELRDVVTAMNLMSSKIKELFNQQEETLERIRNEAYTDTTTGLPNRTYFTMRLQQMIESGSRFELGALFFIEISHLAEINKKSGHMAGDTLLKSVAQLIRQQVTRFSVNEVLTARLSGTTFAVAISGMTEKQAEAFALAFAREMASLHGKGLTPFSEVGHIGFAFHWNQSLSELLSEADMALRAAQIKGPNTTHYHQNHLISEFDTLTATQWIALLNRVIEEKRFTLLVQAVMNPDDPPSVKHHEVLLRIANDENKLIPASLFIPMIHHYGLTKALDKMIVATVLDLLDRPENKMKKIAVNLMPASVSDPEFVNWLSSELARKPALAKRILFELDDYGIAQNLHAAQTFQQAVSSSGAGIGIDHFGRNVTTLSSIGKLTPVYLKIDGSFIRLIDKNRDNQRFVEILVNMAHAQDICVIAESIENEKEMELVKNLHVDGLQGYALHRPEIWMSNIPEDRNNS